MTKLHVYQSVGVVVIGRNEGARLVACLASLVDSSRPIVYVDSGSTDGTIDRVRLHFPDVVVHSLSVERPFSAARARNEGVEILVAHTPTLEFVQFVDGDSVMHPMWLEKAQDHLTRHPDCAVVLGMVKEMFPAKNWYHRLFAMEWSWMPGDIKDCGTVVGTSMFRIAIFRMLRGFNPDVIAGEDSELAVRIKLSGHRVTILDEEMVQHDCNMRHFSEHWSRAVRSGHAIGQRYDLHGRGPLRDCAPEMRSLRIWGIALPAVALLSAVCFSYWFFLFWPIGLIFLFLRVAKYRLRRGDIPKFAFLYAGSIVVGKYAQVVGLLKFYMRRSRQQFHIIEYK